MSEIHPPNRFTTKAPRPPRKSLVIRRRHQNINAIPEQKRPHFPMSKEKPKKSLVILASWWLKIIGRGLGREMERSHEAAEEAGDSKTAMARIHSTLGWISRHVMARTSSKEVNAFSAIER